MHHRRSFHAQAMVEFAIVGMVFFTMLFGTIEFGRLLWTNHELANGTREGARYAMVHGVRGGGPADADAVEAVVLERVVGIDGTLLNTTVLYEDEDGLPNSNPNDLGSADRGDIVTVSTTYTFDFIVGPLLGVGPITLENESRVIVQY